MDGGTHEATVEWSLDGGDFARGRYTRAHLWSFGGGARIPASAAPHIVPPPFSDPTSIDPEEALVAALSSCHMLWFLSVVQREGHTILTYHDQAQGVMGRTAAGTQWLSAVTLRPRTQWSGARPSAEALARLHVEAHAQCYIANSVKTSIHILPE